jgi:hypothetical protein
MGVEQLARAIEHGGSGQRWREAWRRRSRPIALANWLDYQTRRVIRAAQLQDDGTGCRRTAQKASEDTGMQSLRDMMWQRYFCSA